MTEYKLERQLNWDGDILNVHDVVRQVSDGMNKQMEDVVLKHFDMDMSDLREYMHDKIKWERKQELAMPRWIPVTERLPEEYGAYLVYAPGYSGGSSHALDNVKGIMFSRWMNRKNKNRGAWSIEVGYYERPRCVKAWMQLPEPPKGEDDA